MPNQKLTTNQQDQNPKLLVKILRGIKVLLQMLVKKIKLKLKQLLSLLPRLLKV
jgi:hypothetical protein